jgi:hypothetical protein
MVGSRPAGRLASPGDTAVDAGAMTSRTTDWSRELRRQLEDHWTGQLRPRLAGLTDEEYLWEPVPGCWSIRPRGTSTAPIQGGSGALVIEFAAPAPAPAPAPVTTIAWRIGHVVVGVLAMRSASHFGGPAADCLSWDYPPSADDALASRRACASSTRRVQRGRSDGGLRAADGPRGGGLVVVQRAPAGQGPGGGQHDRHHGVGDGRPGNNVTTPVGDDREVTRGRRAWVTGTSGAGHRSGAEPRESAGGRPLGHGNRRVGPLGATRMGGSASPEPRGWAGQRAAL